MRSQPNARAITLIEIVVVVGLVALLYLMVGYSTVQLSRASRFGTSACLTRQERLRTIELLRWQIRCLFVPNEGSCLKGGRLPGEAEEAMSLITSAGQDNKGMVEATYRVLEDEQGKRYLAYREFRTRDLRGLRPWTEQEEARFKPLDRGVKEMRLDYSPDGRIFQREWDAPEPPKAVRVLLTYHDESTFTTTVIPGLGSGRW